MKETYAKVLGSHAADLIKSTSALKPTGVSIDTPPAKIGSCGLGVRINFCGKEADAGEVEGYVICGAVERDDAMPLLKALADYYGFDQKLIQSENGPSDILSEFLNIILGLTGADWSEHGFDINFSPPINVSGQPLDEDYEKRLGFHISIATDSAAKMDIVIVFTK